MTDPRGSGGPGGPAGEVPADRGEQAERPGRRTAHEEVERRRRRARVFGDVLPDRTSDERGDAWGEPDSSSDEWLRRQVPPHHG